MKKTFVLVLSLLLAQISICNAWEVKQSPVNFLGTWNVESEAIYVDASNAGSRADAWGQPKLVTGKSIIKITDQDERRFWGIRTTNNQPPQPFIAIVDPSESTIVAVDQNGSIRGKVLNKNTFTYCYTQVPAKQGDVPYVECSVARRQLKH